MTIDLSRRSFLRGMSALVAAPAVVRVAKLMAISGRALEPRRAAWPTRQDYLEDFARIERELINQMEQRLLFGDPDASPTTFQGFVGHFQTSLPTPTWRAINLYA